MLDDNRQMQRFSISAPAQVELRGGSSSKTHMNLFSRDVCAGGAFFLTSNPLDVGTLVDIRMLLVPRHIRSQIGKKAQVTISGVVLRIDKNGMAIRFDHHYQMSSVRA